LHCKGLTLVISFTFADTIAMGKQKTNRSSVHCSPAVEAAKSVKRVINYLNQLNSYAVKNISKYNVHLIMVHITILT
jgi:hypothetical protein